jgi:hypothetical protein
LTIIGDAIIILKSTTDVTNIPNRGVRNDHRRGTGAKYVGAVIDLLTAIFGGTEVLVDRWGL